MFEAKKGKELNFVHKRIIANVSQQCVKNHSKTNRFAADKNCSSS